LKGGHADPDGDTVDIAGRAPSQLPVPAVALGTVVGGRYRLTDLLGEGGMGQVFVAENMAIGLRVAIKVLKPELMSNALFQTRFLREAKAIAAVQHPNVVRFLDLVLGEPTFLVMELVRGQSLRDHLKEKTRLPIAQALMIAERLARALQAVHDAGVVHRDLKPGNVILAPDRELELAPRIIDFGVVRFATVSEGIDVTRAGQIVGTLHYMAPEQISTGQVDARADLYALGSVLHHMIAGRPPFSGSALDEAQLLHNILTVRAPPVDSPDVPPAVTRLLQQLLEKQPDARPASAEEVAIALARIRAGLATPAAREVEEGPARRRRWQSLAIASGFCIAAAAAFVVGHRTASHAKDNDAGGMIAVDSDPRGAQVEIDGRPVAEPTPTAVRGLALGSHRVRVSAAGRAPVEETVQLRGAGREIVDVKMPPASHFVEIQTKPSDAALFLNDQRLVQRSPVRVELVDNEFYALRIEKDGYETVHTRITPDEHRPALAFALEPAREARGTLFVESNATARVFVDGNDTGFYTPTCGISLPVGAHTAQIRSSAGADSLVYRFEVKAGDTLHVTLDPSSERRRH